MKKMENEYNIVSLGGNCLPRTLLTRYLLKPRKADGELSCVFDLAIHFDVKAIIEYIETSFESYFDDFEFSEEKNYWVKNKTRQFYSHDADCGKNEKEKLVERYKKRIENFYKYLNDPKPTLFVHAIKNPKMKDELYNCIKRIRSDKPFEFAVVNFGKDMVNDNPNIHLLNSKFPSENYDWWVDYDTKEGKVFEKNIAVFCENIIRNHLKCNVIKVKDLNQGLLVKMKRKRKRLSKDISAFIRQSKSLKRNPKKILIIRMGAIGDVVNSTIIHKAIKQKYPECEVQFMTSAFISGILENDPDISKVWGFNISKKDNPFYLLWLGMKLRREKFDLIVNLQGSLRTFILKLLSGCKYQVCKSYTAGHSADVFFKSIEGAFDKLKKPASLSLYVSEKVRKKVQDQIEDLPRPLIAINAGGESDNSRKGRIWPLDNWVELGNTLIEQQGGTVLLLGSKAEKEYQMPLCKIKSSKMFTGELTLEENIGLIEKSDLFISGDSGPLHIAGALGVNVVGLYGSTPPRYCGPYNQIDKVITADYDCLACAQRECARNIDAPEEVYTPCMKAISVEEVLSRVNL